MQRHVRHVVREVEEERPVLVLLDERHGPFGVARRHRVLILVRHRGEDHLFAVVHRQIRIRARLRLRAVRPHVIRIRQAEPFIEAAARWHPFGLRAEVPLARHAGCVILLLQHLGDRRVAGIQPDRRTRQERPVDAHARVVAAGEDRGSRRRAHRRRDVEICEAASLGSHAVEVRRGETFLPKRPDVRVAEIVAENDDDIRRTIRSVKRKGGEQEEEEHFHATMRSRQ